MRPGALIAALGFLGLIVGGPNCLIVSAAETQPPAKSKRSSHAPPFTVWDVELGGPVAKIPIRDLAEIACGTNGGPPSRPLEKISDYLNCAPEEDGLREVYFSYDDEFEYRAKALELPTEASLYAGTTVAGHPVVVSVLVDEKGELQGRRIITDSRAELRDRRRAASLASILKSRFGEGWSCEDFEPQDGEEPLSGVFINQACQQIDPAQGKLTLAVQYMRKKGQHGKDPVTGRAVKGAYQSSTRFEQRRR